MDWLLPVKITVPPDAVNVPLLVMAPATVRLFPLPVKARVAPLAIVRSLTEADVLMTGELGVPEGITTSVVAPGIPPHQLEAVFQLALVAPSQVPEVVTVVVA
jgi:hypothetical protein